MTDELRHVGVMGMRWGHRKGSSQSEQNQYAARSKAIGLVKQRDVVRSKRSKLVKVGDWFLSDNYSSKLFSEVHGKSATAKKGAALSDQIAALRKQRDVGNKILDALLTPGVSSRKFSEMPPRKRRAVTALTAAVLAGGIGAATLL